MLRSLLVGVLALSAASACTGKSDAPAVQPGVAVGKVVEVTGDVSATRGTAKRALATGQEISGDDTIETGADSSVRIVLAHNNATWELGPNRKQLVSESLAWKAPKQDTPAAKVDEATLAAGRHAERETVTTRTTTPEQAPAAAAAPPPAAAEEMKPKGGEGDGAVGAPGGGLAPADTPKPRKALAPVDEVDRGDRKELPRATTSRKSDPPPPPPAPPALEATQVAPDVLVRKRIVEERSALAACLPNDTPIEVEVVVEKGVTSFVLPSSAGAKIQDCFRLAAAKIKFPESYTVRVKTQVRK